MKIILLFFALFSSSVAEAGDGKWTPEQVLKLKELPAKGLRLPMSRLWDPKRGTGLLAGAVNFAGCSGAFVSAEGLVVTNHHCVFPMLQEHSSPARDLIENGFVAKTREEELPGKGVRIQIPKRFVDVTKEVLAAVPPHADDVARFHAIDRKRKAIVAECEKRPNMRCTVASVSSGLEYTLVEAFEVQDVRLVYAPPRGIGEFGGEIDNWSWPRHTGDFAIARAYVDGAPLKPEFFFPLSQEGVKPGDFVMVLGYPAFTVRELLADEMAFREARLFPRSIDVGKEMIAILEAVSDREGKIAVASQLKSLHNRTKNAEGQIAGLARGRIVEKQRQHEEAVVASAAKEALDARRALLEEHQSAEKTFEREFLLDTLVRSSRALYLAATVARLSTEREKPDLDRDPLFMDRELPRLRDRLEREQKNIFLAADKALAIAWVKRALALPSDQRIAAIDRAFGAKAIEREIVLKVEALYRNSKLLTEKERMQMIGAKPAELVARKDPLLDLGFELAAELDQLKLLQDRRAGASSRLRPLWRRAVLAHAKRPLAPDANGTLRVSFAEVKGYAPRDGVFYSPQTTLSGLLAKENGAEPFQIPERVKSIATSKEHGRWIDARLKDVPLCFLSDADTTGGNSGSPVVDGRGRLVGVNFDRVWENVANDFGFNPEVARNISADVRYLLWMLDRVEGADGLLKELGAR